MNFLWSVVGSIFFGLMAGATLSFFIWFMWSKYQDKKLRKLALQSDVVEQMENTKPKIDERGQEEDERKRIEKIRKFEKLRRLGIGEQTIQKSDSFYRGSFQNGEGRRLSSNATNNSKQDSGSNGTDKPKVEWY